MHRLQRLLSEDFVLREISLTADRAQSVITKHALGGLRSHEVLRLLLPCRAEDGSGPPLLYRGNVGNTPPPRCMWIVPAVTTHHACIDSYLKIRSGVVRTTSCLNSLYSFHTGVVVHQI